MDFLLAFNAAYLLGQINIDGHWKSMIFNKYIMRIAGFSLLFSPGLDAWANEPLKLHIDLDSTFYTISTEGAHLTNSAFAPLGTNGPTRPDRNSTILAQADTSDVNMVDELSDEKYKDRLFTTNKMHQYLGIGAIAMGLISALAPKDEDGLHEDAARMSTLLAVGSVGTGFIYHWEDIGGEGGLSDPDNMHTLLAGLGALGIAISTATAPDSSHASTGMLGLTAMLIGVKYTW